MLHVQRSVGNRSVLHCSTLVCAETTQPSAKRGVHSAWSQRTHRSHPQLSQLARSHQRRCAASPTSRLCRRACKAGYRSGQAQKLTLTEGRVLRSVWQQWKRSAPRFSTVAGQEVERLGGHAQVQRILRTRCGAREESTGGSDDSSRRFLELAALCSGTPLSSLWSFPNSTKSHRDGRRALYKGRIGGFERQHAVLCQICGILGPATKDSCSHCPTPTPDQTSTGCPPKLQQSSHGTGKRPRSRQQRKTGERPRSRASTFRRR